MKKILLYATILSSISIPSFADRDVVYLNCTLKVPSMGSVAYSLVWGTRTLPGQNRGALVLRSFQALGKNGTRAIEINPQNIVSEGITTVFSLNLGEKGYAYIYSRGDFSVIDIAFKGDNVPVSTDGPTTDYSCARE